MKITESLQIEHDLIRHMLEAMSQWLTQSTEPEKLRERALMLETAIEAHATREEQELFAPLRVRSTRARELVDLMEVVHAEVRNLFAEVADPARVPEPKERLWTILMLTEEHFNKEEVVVFPMADEPLGSG